MSKFLTGFKALVCAVAALTCGGAWASNIYSHSLAGAQLVNAGTYGAITVPEGGIMAMQFNSATGLKGMGNGNFSSVGSIKNNRKMIDTHTVSGWFKVDSLPTGDATKDVYIMRVGDVSYCGYKVVVNASGQLQIGRINYDSGNYSWNTDGNKRVTFAGESGAIASDTWFHLTIAFTYSSNGSYWRLTPVAWVNGTAATRSGDEYIDINLNGNGTVDDIRIGAKISAAGLYVDNAALSDVEIVKTLATNPDIVVLPNQIAKKYTENDFIPSNDFVDTELKFASIDQVAAYYSIGAVMGGGSINGGSNCAAAKVTSVTRVGDSLFAEIQCSDDGYIKCVMVELKVENGTLRAKERHESYKSGGTVGTKYISVDANGNCSNANSAASGTGGYRIRTLHFLPVVKPIAKWSSIEANAKGGLYGTPGYNFTMTADTGCTIADGMGKMTKNNGTANLGLKIGWNDADYTSKQLTVVFEYEDYDGSNLGYHSIFSAGWGEDTDLVIYGNNNNGGNIGISSGATSTEGGTQHMVNPVEYIPRAGKMMVTMSGSGSWSGTKIAFAPKYADDTYHNFRQVKEDTRDKVNNGQFHYVRFGGTISPIGKYHRPAINIKSVEIYDQAVDASMLLEIARPSATALGDYAQFYSNFQDRVVTMAEGTNTGDLGNKNSGIKYAIFDLPTMTSTDTKFAGNGTNYTVFPGAYATSANGLGWKAFCDGQTGYSAPGLVLRIPAYDASRPFQIKSTFGPFCLAGMVIESGAANGSEIPTLMWDGTNRETSLGDRRASGSVPTFFILHDSYKINHGSTTTIYGDITFDIDSGKGLHIVSGAITINDGAILRLKGAGQIVTKTNSNSTGVVDASGKTLDFTGKTSAHTVGYFDGPLTVSSETALCFPASLAANEAFKLCEGTLVAPEETVYATVLIGETEKRVALTYDAQTKSVSYDDTQATFGEEKYSTLAGAIEAAQTAGGGEVKIVYPEVVGGGVTVPSGVIINLNGNTITGTLDIKEGAYLKDGNTVLINGIATSVDDTFVHFNDHKGNPNQHNIRGTLDYQELSGTNMQYDNDPEFVGYETDQSGNKIATKDTGVKMNSHPYIQGLPNSWWEATQQLTLAVVGTMPTDKNTTFIHMGHTESGGKGLLLATGTKDDEVIIAWNDGASVPEDQIITTISVPNAATARHVYIVTKNDNPAADTTTFTVYLDGMKWKTLDVTPLFTIKGGVQVGSDFGGKIRDAGTYSAANGDSGVVNVIRLYDRVISDAEIAQYSVDEEFPYHSPKGSSARTFGTGTANWVEDQGTPWSNRAMGAEEATSSNAALDGSSIETTLSGNITVTVNAAEEGVSYEALSVKGSGAVTFERGDSSGAIRVTGVATIGRPITVKPGSLDLETAIITIADEGEITFDYSDFDVSSYYKTTKINLTGQIDRNDAKMHFTAPTSCPYRTAEMAYDSSIKQYVLTITPNHQDGDRVYFNAASTYFDGTLAGKVELEDGTKTVLFPNDIVVLAGGKTLPTWVGKPACAGIAVETDVTLGMGAKSDVDQSLITAALDGKTVTIAQNKTLTLNNADRNWTFGSVTMNGSGSVLVKGAVTATSIAGNATLKLANNATLTVGTELTVGRVVSNESNMVIVKESINSQTVYSLAYASTAEDVVIETMPDAGVTIQPGAVVTVTLSGEATPEDLAAIAEKVAVKYTLPGTETVKDLKAEGLVTVSVNQETGAVELTTTNDAIPAATDIEMAAPTEEGTDKIQFTITSPIPGLFYAVSSCDTPDGTFESATGDQATSSEAKTVSIPMTFGENQKVKYYRVNVKATK